MGLRSAPSISIWGTSAAPTEPRVLSDEPSPHRGDVPVRPRSRRRRRPAAEGSGKTDVHLAHRERETDWLGAAAHQGRGSRVTPLTRGSPPPRPDATPKNRRDS